MIKMVCTTLYSDDALSESVVSLERDPRGRLEIHAAPRTATHLLANVLLGEVAELFADTPDGTYALPPQYDLHSVVPDELVDLVNALQLVEPGFSKGCQFPPCILSSSRMVKGYSLCEHHGDGLLGYERHLAA